MNQIHVIDSHTGGEPTRIIVSGGPELGTGPIPERVDRFRTHFDGIRTAVVNEPRGSDVWIGGLLCEPTDASFTTGIIFFNTASYLGMCGHGTIGLMVTLRHLGRVGPGMHRLETPVGTVTAELVSDHKVTFTNVVSYRLLADVNIQVPGVGEVIGDVAWGGNWFFCVKNVSETLNVQNEPRLTAVTISIRDALDRAGITGEDGAYIDHIELYGEPRDPANHSRNFVLTPGGSYDRSPCGTGTSAKIACLAADGLLEPGQPWRQESVVGSLFECTYQPDSAGVLPTITGSAFVTAESTLILEPSDPFCMGIRG